MIWVLHLKILTRKLTNKRISFLQALGFFVFGQQILVLHLRAVPFLLQDLELLKALFDAFWGEVSGYFSDGAGENAEIVTTCKFNAYIGLSIFANFRARVVLWAFFHLARQAIASKALLQEKCK